MNIVGCSGIILLSDYEIEENYMAKCIRCGKSGAEYEHYNGGYVCEDCVGSFFTCPDCGRVFDADDFENGDAGNGFCSDCAPNH